MRFEVCLRQIFLTYVKTAPAAVKILRQMPFFQYF